MNAFDYDWLIIGSGFGGSVSALRLAEKGYKVGVLEAGRRYRDEDYAKTTWDLKRFLWAPSIGLRGIFRLTPFKDVFIASGAAVGGGSVVYANTLYRASPEFFVNPQWAGINDWSAALAPHYDTAEKMLGVQTVPHQSDGQDLLREVGRHFGVEDTFSRTPVGVFFGKPGTTVPDPYFGGEGPARTGCTRCGACMVGCREGAKNTLVKNYLWFAEKRGVEIHPEREVVDIRPIGAEDGADGYTVTTERPGAWFRKQRRTFTARGIVISAGALGTNQLLARCKLAGSLPGISDRLGALVRTNSESILAVTLPEGLARPWNDVAISASIYPRADTHIEFVTYGKHGDFMSLLYTLITGKGTRDYAPAQVARQHRAPSADIPEDAVAGRLVAALGAVPRDAEPRQCDFVPGEARPVRWRVAEDRAGPGKAEPDVHRGRQPGRRMAGRAHGRLCPEHGARGVGQRPDDRAHPRRRGHRTRCLERRRRCAEPAVRVPEFPGLRRIHGASKSWRQPIAHDHRNDRARDEPDSRQGLVRRVMRAVPGA